jgi:hypothetical protein
MNVELIAVGGLHKKKIYASFNANQKTKSGRI